MKKRNLLALTAALALSSSAAFAASSAQDAAAEAASAAPVETIGKITDVLEGGAAQLLEVRISEACSVLADDVKRTVSGKPKTAYVPFTEEHIGAVDIERKTVELMHLWILE